MMDEALRAFLEEIAGEDQPLDVLEREAEHWADSPDLNEAWIASLRFRARQLLSRLG